VLTLISYRQAQFEKELDEMKEMFDTQLKESEHMVQDLKNLKQIVVGYFVKN
jgi:hypothetical protein